MSRHIVTFTLRREELLLDVKNIAYVMGSSATQKDAPTADDNWLLDIAQVIAEGGDNNELATRAMNLAWAECDYKLSAWGMDVGPYESHDDTYIEHDVYTTTLSVPGTMKKAAVKLLIELLHNFVVYKVLCCWCHIIGREEAAKLKDAVENLEAEIRSVIANEGSVKYRPMFPFEP